MNEIAQAMLLLCLVAVLGLALGNINIKGIGLGIGGVLFSGIAVGHFAGQYGIETNPHMMEFIREFGLILFVYTIGIQVGPGFFAALKRSGLKLNALAASLVVLGVLVASAIHIFADIPLPVVLGLFSGAVTNTPSLAAGQQILKEVGASADALVLPGLGYAVAYPFAIAGILLSMWLIRFILRINIDKSAEEFESQRRSEVHNLDTMNLTVRNPNLDGLPLREVPGMEERGVVASRMLRNGKLQIPDSDMKLAVGDVLHMVGPRKKLKEMRLILGEEAQVELTTKGTHMSWERIVVTSSNVFGKSIAELNIRQAHNVVISRVNRSGIELVPAPALTLQFGDILTVIGQPEDIQAVSRIVGNVKQLLHQVQMIPIFLGIALGVLLGSLPFYLPGVPAAVKLGLAGGPLIVAIVLSRVGNIGPLIWFMPASANLALREIGIILFLAVVGLKSGAHFMETLVGGEGLMWIAYGVMITLIPLFIVGFFAQLFMKFNYLTTCGLLAGSMTDPPALAFANSVAPSEAPALAYATVYPLVMCLRILAPQVMVLALWSTGG